MWSSPVAALRRAGRRGRHRDGNARGQACLSGRHQGAERYRVMSACAHCPALLYRPPRPVRARPPSPPRWRAGTGVRVASARVQVRAGFSRPDGAGARQRRIRYTSWTCGWAARQDVASACYEAAGEADLILIEGVMGLFDGTPSSADLAAALGVPVLAVIDGSAMAQTFGALAADWRTIARPAVPACRQSRRQRLPRAVVAREPAAILHWLGALPRDASLALPSGISAWCRPANWRHRCALDALADAWAQHASPRCRRR